MLRREDNINRWLTYRRISAVAVDFAVGRALEPLAGMHDAVAGEGGAGVVGAAQSFLERNAIMRSQDWRALATS